MSEIWIKVLQGTNPGDKKYFWDRYNDQVHWDPPPGVRVVWTMERHQETGRVYYWNKDTRESIWTLPPLGQQPQQQQQHPAEGWSSSRDGGGSSRWQRRLRRED